MRTYVRSNDERAAQYVLAEMGYGVTGDEPADDDDGGDVTTMMAIIMVIAMMVRTYGTYVRTWCRWR